ncbi:MAG: hypothetical protein LKF79_00555 [Solobacterium sp.]|jgi:hypothetical protein|nr:hypothetical protein [Solobacterium sp.]MCH4222376.1 hypothetical protein [Solobacterium sp.]MCH4265117.1 hypothetical protein [Solobacterium sp.]
MGKVYNSDVFYYVAVVGFLAYAVYYLYGISKYFLKAQKIWKEYGTAHAKQNLRKENQYHWWLAILLAFVVYCFYSCATIPSTANQAEWFRLAFAFVGLILLGQAMTAVVKRRVMCSDDGFVYEDFAGRWQSIINMQPQRKGLVMAVDLMVTNGKHYTVPRGIGLVLHDAQLAFKDRKKKEK